MGIWAIFYICAQVDRYTGKYESIQADMGHRNADVHIKSFCDFSYETHFSENLFPYISTEELTGKAEDDTKQFYSTATSPSPLNLSLKHHCCNCYKCRVIIVLIIVTVILWPLSFERLQLPVFPFVCIFLTFQ